MSISLDKRWQIFVKEQVEQADTHENLEKKQKNIEKISKKSRNFKFFILNFVGLRRPQGPNPGSSIHYICMA